MFHPLNNVQWGRGGAGFHFDTHDELVEYNNIIDSRGEWYHEGMKEIEQQIQGAVFRSSVVPLLQFTAAQER